MTANPKTIIIGGGWAGLSAALTLAPHQEVLVLERAPELGGRARSITFQGETLDNGQHLLLGAYQTCLDLIKETGCHPDSVLARQPLVWTQIKPDSDNSKTTTHCHLEMPASANSCQRLQSLMRAQGLNWRHKLRLLQQGIKGVRSHSGTVANALAGGSQHAKEAYQLFYEPMCLAAMSTDATIASQQVFSNVLREAFLAGNQHLDYLFPKVGLSDVFPNPCRARLEQLGSNVQTRTGVTALEYSDSKITAVILLDGQRLEAEQFILATPPRETARLLASHPKTQALSKTIDAFQPAPITTVYLMYDRPVKLAEPMLGLTGVTSEWCFDRSFAGQAHILSVVVTGDIIEQAATPAERTALVGQIASEVEPLIDPQAKRIASKLIRERFAAFCCDTASDKLRVNNRTPLDNLWLAGDYTDTGLPSTIEGAMRSGVTAAKQVK